MCSIVLSSRLLLLAWCCKFSTQLMLHQLGQAASVICASYMYDYEAPLEVAYMAL
jgi:hypothetical protein